MNNDKPVQDTEPSLSEQLDQALRKYVFVWVWSVLFGTATGAALTFANYRSFGRFRMADLLMGLLVATGGAFTILSVYNLYLFLMRILLPMFLEGGTAKLRHDGIELLAR